MARPERKDVDYFPFIVKDGKTLFVLESKYECKGVGFFTNLCRFLSKTPDHHFCIKDDGDELYFFASVKCDQESGLDMIKMMVKTKKLDRDLWEQKRVLASQDFLDSIQDAYRNRKNDIITIEEIKLLYGITSGENPQEGGKPTKETTPKDESGGVSSGENPQTKLKETKLKETKQTDRAQSASVSKHFEAKLDPDIAEKIIDHCRSILTLPSKNNRGFNPFQAVQKAVNKSQHPNAILEAIEALINYWSDIDNPWSYFWSILKTKSQNYNERQHMKQSEQFETIWASDEIKALIGDIGTYEYPQSGK